MHNIYYAYYTLCILYIIHTIYYEYKIHEKCIAPLNDDDSISERSWLREPRVQGASFTQRHQQGAAGSRKGADVSRGLRPVGLGMRRVRKHGRTVLGRGSDILRR